MNCYCTNCLKSAWLNNQLTISATAFNDLLLLAKLTNLTHKENN